MKIGIAISHHNRHDILAKTIAEFAKYKMPRGTVVEIIDDASDEPTDMATFRFEQNVGIARTKNKGIELLMQKGCDHLFLFDDDTYPIADNWWVPYIESKQPHLMLNFTHYSDGREVGDCIEVYRDYEIVAQGNPRGCMLYMERKVIDIVGGFNTAFGKAMEEHIEYSQRVFNAKLTTFKFADVVDSEKLIYSTDWDKSQRLQSSISTKERNAWRRNRELLEQLKYDASFQPYTEPSKENRAVITTFFTSGIDTQRQKVWDADKAKIQPLIDSVVAHKEKIVILNDCGWSGTDGFVTWVNMQSFGNPYFWRWYAEYLYLRNANLDVAWLVDATDVLMLENPFEQMQPGTFYSGDERGTLGTSQWMIRHSKTQEVRREVMGSNTPLLNCGLVGGSATELMKLCRDMWDMHAATKGVYEVEMPIYNYLLKGRDVVHGRPVNTLFKAEQTEGAWWKHK